MIKVYLSWALSVLLFVFLFFGSGCNLVSIRTSECDALVPVNGITLAFCGWYAEENRDIWLNETLDIVYAMDDALAELWMPPISKHFDKGVLIRLNDKKNPEDDSGFYRGYAEPETSSIDLYLSTGDTPVRSAFAHETGGHLYDHRENKVLTLAEWESIGRHFLWPAFTDHVVKKGRARGGPEPETALNTLFCGGVE